MADLQKYGRTANLFDDEIESGYYNDSGVLVSDSTTSHSTTYIPVNGTTYTASGLWYRAEQMANFAVYEWDNNKNWLRRSNRQYPPSSNKITFTIGADTAYITLQVQTEHGNIMLNTGSTALPYEPYLDWVHSLRKLTTATEAVENPLYSDGTAITSYTISGNTVQNGTPTPSNPVDVNGVGVRTENLFDVSKEAKNTYITHNGTTGASSVTNTSDYTEINTPIITLSGTRTTELENSNNRGYTFYTDDKTVIEGSTYSPDISIPVNITVPNNAVYIRFSYDKSFEGSVMLNSGSTAKPYEPYGYKIPISSGGVTTNIYLGSTQTVRQIKKIVFDGTENWNESACSIGYRFVLPITGAMPSDTTIGVRSMCTHQILTSTGNTYNTLGTYTITGTPEIIMTLDGDTRLASWKLWLAAQYAAGTPVTVWYVLVTAETAAVNEPLMKIGTYADTLSNATAIPTTEGANSITVDTTVQPSEFTATWTGWHNATVKEWDGSQWNE